jgi:FkbM family methyltransferase
MLKRVLQGIANRLGYHVGRNPPENSLGRDLQSLLQRKDINCVVDVGAHRGEYGSLLRTLGYVARIISFEPVPESFAALAALAQADSNWSVQAVALGRETGTLPIKVMVGSTFSSFRVPSEFARARFGTKVDVVRQVDVRVEQLENVLDACGSTAGESTHIFLKCDTQGHDLEVVRGAGNAIGRVLGLQVELPLKAVYDGLPSFTESFDELRALGFEVVGIYPVTRDDCDNVIEVDCLMQRAT